ncbi:Uncharacterised protein [Achromobacter sp. 2789STDY5608615]|nr:Uncharacterised protein [Achromobacter sp. 2789STDY5608615]
MLRLPPPRVPKPVKPTTRGCSPLVDELLAYVPKLIHQLEAMSVTPGVPTLPWRHSQLLSAALGYLGYSTSGLP